MKKEAKTLPKTVKQKKWIKRYIETGNGSEAAKEVYNVTSDDSARAIASQNFQKLDMTTIMDSMGLTDKKLMGILDDGLGSTKFIGIAQEREVSDYPTRHKYLDTALKLKDKYPKDTVGLSMREGDKELKVIVTRG